MLEILLVDHDSDATALLNDALCTEGHRVTVVSGGAIAADLVGRRCFDVVLCEAGSTMVEEAVGALADASTQYLGGPFEPSEIAERVGRLTRKGQVRIIGRSSALLRMLARIDLFAASEAPVLITGESGTGKELVARSLHERSARSAGPFVAVNCAGFPESLIEAELFGHEKGAFTGAVKKRDGRFRAADTGTLFLDEVAEIPIAAQAKLLRVLQDGSFEPLGTNETLSANVRILSATHRNLQKRVAEGLFREDLYYRLKILELDVPPLREREEDIPLLANRFLAEHAPGKKLRLSEAAVTTLRRHAFRGNVRELEHAIRHAIALAGTEREIDVRHLPQDVVAGATVEWPAGAWAESSGLPLREALREFEREYLRRALSHSKGKKGRAAEALGISRKNLWERMRRLALTEKHDDGDDDGGLEV